MQGFDTKRGAEREREPLFSFWIDAAVASLHSVGNWTGRGYAVDQAVLHVLMDTLGADCCCNCSSRHATARH